MLSPEPSLHRSIMFWALSLLLYGIGVFLFVQGNYQASKQQLLQGADNQLLAAAHSLPLSVDEKLQDQALRRKNTSDKNTYTPKSLNQYIDNLEITHIYSLVLINDQVVLTSSSSPLNTDVDELVTARFDNRNSQAFYLLQEATRSGKSRSVDLSEHDEHIRSLFLPLRTDNGTRYIAAADLNLATIEQSLQKELYRSIFSALVLLLFAAPIFYTLNRQLSRQCKSIRNELNKRVQELALSKRINNQYLMSFRVNALGQVTEISDAYMKTTGASAERFLGNNFKELFGDYIDYENLRRIHDAIANEKPLEFCSEHPHQNNGSFYAQINVLPWAPERSDRRNNMSDELQEITHTAGSGAVFIVEDLSASKMLETSRMRDEKTRLYNRRYFNEIVPREINRARRENNPLMLLLVELNAEVWLEEFENSELVISTLAHKLQRLCQRSSDFVFRLNELEFAIVCTTDSDIAAKAFSNKVYQQVESALQLLTENSYSSTDKHFAIGVSINSPQAPVSLGEFYRRAHHALLQQQSANAHSRKAPATLILK